MMGSLLLLIFGKLQDQFAGNSAAWQWAAAFALINALTGAILGMPITAAAVTAGILFLYAWGYFALLRRFTDQLLIWLTILFAGALLPLLLNFVQAA